MLLDCKRTGIVILTLSLAITLSAQNRVVTYDTVKTNVLKTIGNRYSVFVPSVSSNDTLATHGYVGANSVWLDSVSHHNTRISYLEDSVQKATKYHTQAITSISYLTDSLSTRYWRGDTSYALASKNWVSGNYQPAGTYLIPADSTANRTFSNLKYATVDSLATHRTAINSLTDSVTKATKYHNQSIVSVTGLQDSLNKAMDSISVTAPIAKTGTQIQPTISIPAASASASGYLTSADWTTFNNGIIQNQLFETDINNDAMPSTTGTVSLVFELDENSDITPKL